MMKVFIFATFLAAACAYSDWAIARIDPKDELKNRIKTGSNDDARCKKSVTQHTETLHFVRQSAGDLVIAKVTSNYVPIEQLNQVMSSSGLLTFRQWPPMQVRLKVDAMLPCYQDTCYQDTFY
jgi:hypothetical protein